MRFEALKNFKSVDKKYYTEKTSRSKNDSYKTNENNSHKKERNDSYKKERNELDILNSITEFPELTNSKKILEKKPTINYKNICYKDKPKNLIKTNDILQDRYYNYEIEPDILD